MKKFVHLLLNLSLAFAVASVPALAAKEKKASAAAKSADAGKESKSAKKAPTTPVDINSASQAQLESLPGVGAATAKKIIAGRPYSGTSDLSKAGIPAKTIQQITPMIVAGPAVPGAAGAASTTAAKKPKAAANSTPATSTTAAPGTTPPPAATKAAAAKTASTYTPPPSPGMVWVNPDTKVFHKEGDRWYGKTKSGKYMTEADARKAGYREAKK